jgi:hypothetical protein
VPFNGVQCDPSFELRAVPFPLCRHLPAPRRLNAYSGALHSILIACPGFGVHYKYRTLLGERYYKVTRNNTGKIILYLMMLTMHSTLW